MTDGRCLICEWHGHSGRYETDPHEIYEGKNRQESIYYGMVIDVCFNHHRMIHDQPSQELNRELKRWGQKQFEILHPDIEFIRVFGRNYL